MLKIRVATALVLLAILLPALFLCPEWVWAAVSGVLIVVAMSEWANLLGQSRRGILAAVLLAVLCAVAYRGLQEDPTAPAWTVFNALLVLYWCLGGALRLASGDARGGGLGMALILLLGSWVALVALREIGIWALLSAMGVVWVADIAAYFAGRAFGRRKLAPNISPGKSWEGAIGGFLCVLLYGVVVALWAPPEARTLPGVLAGHSWVLMAVVLLAMAGLSIVGDLHESLLKRQAGVKDSGRLLPGHGGVLDRIDALLPVMPAALAVYQFLR